MIEGSDAKRLGELWKLQRKVELSNLWLKERGNETKVTTRIGIWEEGMLTRLGEVVKVDTTTQTKDASFNSKLESSTLEEDELHYVLNKLFN